MPKKSPPQQARKPAYYLPPETPVAPVLPKDLPWRLEDLRHLTQLEQIFVAEYLQDFNLARAARCCGFPERNASTEGRRLMKSPAVMRAVDGAIQAYTQKLLLTKEQVLLELSMIAFSNVTDYTLEAGKIALAPGVGPRAWQAVQQVTVHEGRDGTRMTLKLHDKLTALKFLGQHLGLFDDTEASEALARYVIVHKYGGQDAQPRVGPGPGDGPSV